MNLNEPILSAWGGRPFIKGKDFRPLANLLVLKVLLPNAFGTGSKELDLDDSRKTEDDSLGI